MGHAPGDDELYAIILGSLPYSFEPFISALNATSSVLGTILSPNDLMQAFTDEYERRNLGKLSKREESTENVAFSTNEGNRWKGNGQKGNCYNCGKPGHRKDDCWEEGGGKEDQKPNWLKEKEKWWKEKQEGRKKEEEKPKAKDSATTAMMEDVAWMAYLPDPMDDGNEPILFSDDEISLDDFLEADEEIRKEMTKGQKEPQEECYSTQDTDPASTSNWVHKTTSSKPEEERLDWRYELIEGEREDFNEQVDEVGNQPIPQLEKPENEEVERTDDDLSTTKSARDAEEDQAMALWLYDPEDDENGENGEEDEVNQVSVTVKNVVEDLEPPHMSSDKSRGEGEGGVSWVNSRKHLAMMNEAKGRCKVNPKPAERRKVNSEMEDDAKSIPHTVSMPTDPNVTLSKGQHSYNLAEMANTGGIPYFEANGSPMYVPINTSPTTTVAAPTVTGFLEKPGATLSEAVKHDFRDLGGTRNMRLVHRKEEEDLLGWEDPGEAPQHRTEGYMPIVDGETVPWINPREQGLETLRERGRGKECGRKFHATDKGGRAA
jgi:hypothetical protein